MVLGWLSKIAGPRVLLGVTIAGALGIGFMWWQYENASTAAVQAEQRTADLRSALESERQAVDRLEAERQNLEDALADARAARERARDRASAVEADMRELEDENEDIRAWARARVPDAVAQRLREYAGRARDQDEGAAADATE